MAFADATAGLHVPPSLQAGVARHRVHLSQLAVALRAARLPDAQIAASLDALVASYRAELINVLNALRNSDSDAR